MVEILAEKENEGEECGSTGTMSGNLTLHLA